jgi:YebC/PmpR family DNA-binding regulatory protein
VKTTTKPKGRVKARTPIAYDAELSSNERRRVSSFMRVFSQHNPTAAELAEMRELMQNYQAQPVGSSRRALALDRVRQTVLAVPVTVEVVLHAVGERPAASSQAVVWSAAAAVGAERGRSRLASKALEPSMKPRRVALFGVGEVGPAARSQQGATGWGSRHRERSLFVFRDAGAVYAGVGKPLGRRRGLAQWTTGHDALWRLFSRLESLAMAGHSKWAGIKHKKAIVDSRRGKLFTKLARAITVAAKEGGGDVVGNAALGLAVQKAKDASMPKDNIERAIAKGTGAGADADTMEAVMYEGYGPGGVAMLVEAFTDNRNRTGSEIRHAFAKHGGNLGEPGSVAYLFDKKGVVVVDGEKYSEEDLMPALDAGAEDIVLEDDVYEILCEPSDLTAMRAALVDAGIGVSEAQVMQRPKTLVPLDEDGAVKLLKLIDTLEDLDDTDTVHANFDVDAEILERVAG